MRTQIEHYLLRLSRILRARTSSKVVEAVWVVLLRRHNARIAKHSQVLWERIKAESEAAYDTPLWTAPEMDEVSKMRNRKAVDLMVAEMVQERELAELKAQARASGSDLEVTLVVA